MASNEEILGSIVSESCISLFRDYSLPLLRADDMSFEGDSALLYCGALGFSGEQIRGTLVLATSQEPLGRTTPIQGSSHHEWIAELANQLLGRIKNKLLPHGVTLHLSTPIVLRGDYRGIVPRKPDSTPFAFRCDNGAVCVWFDAELIRDLDLSKIEPDTEAVDEGEMLLF